MTIPERIAHLDKLLDQCEIKLLFSISSPEIWKAYWRKRLDIQLGEDFD